MDKEQMQPTYYVAHPDGTYSVADPQPVLAALSFDAKKVRDEALEEAPESNLPAWSDCQRIIENHEFRQRAALGLEGQVLDTAPTDPEPSALHRFIYEYDDADPYRSAWFMHRLELVLKECAEEAIRSPKGRSLPAAADKDAERYRWLVDHSGDAQGSTRFHVWQHTWEPHSQTGEPTEWKCRVRGPALDRAIDAAIAKAGGKE